MSNEMFYYDRNTLVWTDISAMTTAKQGVLARGYFGFAGAGEKLYLHAGYSIAGIIPFYD
jgi:hypothetical protein